MKQEAADETRGSEMKQTAVDLIEAAVDGVKGKGLMF